MSNLLSTLKEQRLREEYGDYCLRGILGGREAKPFEEFQGESVTHKCKSGRHVWFFKEDAKKCCNGFRRMLVFNDPKACDSVVLELLPGGVSYGYRWVPV